MSSNDASELSLTVSQEEALQALLDAMPKDAVVRDEDDGVGRFAGERTVAIIGRRRDRLMLFEGTWGSIKPRLDHPHVDVVFEGADQGVIARLTKEPQAPPGLGAHVGEFVNRALTVAVAVVAYYWWKSIPIDYPMIAAIAGGGGVAWTVVAMFLPKKEVRGLDDLARDALAPLVKKKKKKKKGKKTKSEKAEAAPDAAAPDEAAPGDSP